MAFLFHRKLSILGRYTISRSIAKRSYAKILNTTKRSIEIENTTNRICKISTIWLRDHCRCEKCYNKTTNQRSTDVISLLKICEPEKVEMTENNKALKIDWTDGHRSTFSLQWLEENLQKNPNLSREKLCLWSGELMYRNGGLPSVNYDEIVSKNNDGVARLIDKIKKFGVACATGAPVDFEATKKLCELVAMPDETTYGKFWQFSAENMDHADTAYTNLALGAHTDLTYYEQTAGIQVFHLLEHTGKGGETLLVDGFHAGEILRQRDISAFDILTKTAIPHVNIDSGDHHYSLEPVISVNSQTGAFKQIRFNPYDRDVLKNFTSFEEVEKFYHAYVLFASIIRESSNEFWIKLKPGTVIFIDNFRVLHGRSAFDGKRVMCGCYLQRDDYLSKTRALKLLENF